MLTMCQPALGRLQQHHCPGATPAACAPCPRPRDYMNIRLSKNDPKIAKFVGSTYVPVKIMSPGISVVPLLRKEMV